MKKLFERTIDEFARHIVRSDRSGKWKIGDTGARATGETGAHSNWRGRRSQQIGETGAHSNS
jgi:hypothetical protein